MNYPQTFDDGRGGFPDYIGAAAPRGLKDRVKRAAEAERMTLAEFVRQAIEARLRASVGTTGGSHAVG